MKDFVWSLASLTFIKNLLILYIGKNAWTIPTTIPIFAKIELSLKIPTKAYSLGSGCISLVFTIKYSNTKFEIQ